MNRLPQSWDEELLSAKELAAKLGRNISYVRAMRRRGFAMIAGRTTLSVALEWLAENPRPWATARNRTISR